MIATGFWFCQLCLWKYFGCKRSLWKLFPQKWLASKLGDALLVCSKMFECQCIVTITYLKVNNYIITLWMSPFVDLWLSSAVRVWKRKRIRRVKVFTPSLRLPGIRWFLSIISFFSGGYSFRVTFCTGLKYWNIWLANVYSTPLLCKKHSYLSEDLWQCLHWVNPKLAELNLLANIHSSNAITKHNYKVYKLWTWEGIILAPQICIVSF